MYKILVRAIEIDDPHVLSYEWVKFALMILAEGPEFESVCEYLHPDGTITLDGTDKFCNYATSAICLLYVYYMSTIERSDDVLAARAKLVALFGRNASAAHIRARCFALIFSVGGDNVIRWSGELFAELADACADRANPSWVDCFVDMFRRLQGRLSVSNAALYSSNRENDRLVKELNRTIHYESEIGEIKAAVAQIRETQLEECARAPAAPDDAPPPRRPVDRPGSQFARHTERCKLVIDCLEDYRRALRDTFGDELRVGITKHLGVPSVRYIADWITNRTHIKTSHRMIDKVLFNALGVSVDTYALMRNIGRQKAEAAVAAEASMPSSRGKPSVRLKLRSPAVTKHPERINPIIVMYWSKLPTDCHFVLIRHKPTQSGHFDTAGYVKGLCAQLQVC